MRTLRTTWYGAFLVEGAEVVQAELFPKDAREIARRLALLQQGELLREERRLAEGAEAGVLVTERRQLKLGSLAPPSQGPADLAARAQDYGYGAALKREAFELAASAALARARGRDLTIVQALRAHDELRDAENRVNERLREWYGLHFPELARLVPSERYAAVVASGQTREDLMRDLGLEGVGGQGSALAAEDIESVQSVAKAALSLRSEAERQASALSTATRAVAPNLCELLGPLLAARLIEAAGSIARLARMPSSTVQVLGAEQALFRHLKQGKRPPKHGLLFQHPAIHTAPRWARGRLSRALAGKATIAARADAAGRRADLGRPLRERFEARARQIEKEGPTRHHRAPPAPRTAPDARAAAGPPRRPKRHEERR